MANHIIGFIPLFDVYSQGYPFLEAIYSHLMVCDDIYILDASKDSTIKILQLLKNKRIHIYHTKLESYESQNGEIISKMANTALNIVRKKERGQNYVFYFQANEIIHQDSYNFFRNILERYPNYNNYLLYYYELFGRYLFGEQFRLRLTRLTNVTHAIGDGWALDNPIVNFNYVKSLIYQNLNTIITKHKFSDVFYIIYNRYRFVYSPTPVYRYSRIFPRNTMLKLKAHEMLFKNSYFSKLKSQVKYKSTDEFFKKLCKLESIKAKNNRKEFPRCQKVIDHPKIMQEILDKPKYFARAEIIDLINKL
ncbi:MAG: hypothetical protein QXP35_02955 [Candidatus Micrarchaeaceae archaeon]